MHFHLSLIISTHSVKPIASSHHSRMLHSLSPLTATMKCSKRSNIRVIFPAAFMHHLLATSCYCCSTLVLVEGNLICFNSKTSDAFIDEKCNELNFHRRLEFVVCSHNSHRRFMWCMLGAIDDAFLSGRRVWEHENWEISRKFLATPQKFNRVLKCFHAPHSSSSSFMGFDELSI